MSEEQAKTFSRRNVLKVLAGAGVAAQGPSSRLLASEAPHCSTPLAHGATTLAAAKSAPQFFTTGQIRTLTALCETIIPADEHSLGAAAAGVPAYIDEVVSNSKTDHKTLWTEGLAAMDRLAEQEFAAPFAACTAEQQDKLLLKISANEDNPATPEEQFFVTIKRATIDGYYTSEIGLRRDLEYQGNEVLAEFEGCTHPEHKTPVKS